MSPPTPTMANGNAQRRADNWSTLYKASHQNTWTYLKKKMISYYRNMEDSRSYIDAMFGI